jgi:hypothetical protein
LRETLNLGGAHLPPCAIGVLLFLLALNPLLKVAGKRWAFSRAEVLTIYITCLFSCLIPGHGGENYFVSSLVGSFYYASPENKWLEFLKVLPNWFSPALQNPDVARGWQEGAGGVVPWSAWLVPLLMWSTLTFALYTMLGWSSNTSLGNISGKSSSLFSVRISHMPIEVR